MVTSFSPMRISVITWEGSGSTSVSWSTGRVAAASSESGSSCHLRILEKISRAPWISSGVMALTAALTLARSSAASSAPLVVEGVRVSFRAWSVSRSSFTKVTK